MPWNQSDRSAQQPVAGTLLPPEALVERLQSEVGLPFKMTRPDDGVVDTLPACHGIRNGYPSIFDVNGNHCGYNKVYRSSTFVDGKTTYMMHTKIQEGQGDLLPRMEVSDIFLFGVIDSDQDRIYLGPDFIGAGHPYGTLVDAHYYSPGWTGDLRTMVHILPDGETQVYSSLIFDGPTLFTVFNGIYKVAFDYHTHPETKARIDAFCETERINGRKPHILPSKKNQGRGPK